MKSTKNKRAITVGIFIFLGLAIFIIGILTLGGQHKTFERSITLRAVFDDVSGLQQGNNIWFSGVKIGTVKKIEIHGNAQVAVTMSIQQQVKQFIKKDAKAKIGSEGFIGNKIVVIYGGTPQFPVINDGETLSVEKAISTDDMMATLQQNNKNLLDITNSFKLISKNLSEGQGTVGKLLNDDALVNNLQSAISTLNKASLNARRLTSNLADYSSKLQTEGSLTNNLITDTVVFKKLRETVSQFQEVSNTASSITNNLKTASNELNNANSPIGTLLYDKGTASDIKATVKNLQSSTEKLDENMEALQHNFLLRGFFRKKAKTEEKENKQKADSTLHQ